MLGYLASVFLNAYVFANVLGHVFLGGSVLSIIALASRIFMHFTEFGGPLEKCKVKKVSALVGVLAG